LIYALFERENCPDGAFLSKRWCSLEDILEHSPPGLMLNKIKEWEAGRAARAKRAVQDLLSQAEAQLGEAVAEAMQEERAEARLRLRQQMLSDGGGPSCSAACLYSLGFLCGQCCFLFGQSCCSCVHCIGLLHMSVTIRILSG
jgi:hypothetical protein